MSLTQLVGIASTRGFFNTVFRQLWLIQILAFTPIVLAFSVSILLLKNKSKTYYACAQVHQIQWNTC